MHGNHFERLIRVVKPNPNGDYWFCRKCKTRLKDDEYERSKKHHENKNIVQ